MSGNTIHSVLQSFEDYIDSSQLFTKCLQETLLPKLTSSTYNLHKLKEKLNESIINYGNQRFDEGVKSVEKFENNSVSLVIESPKVKSQNIKDGSFIFDTNEENIKTNKNKNYEDKIKELNDKINSLQIFLQI